MTVFILIGVIALIEAIHFIERRDLYNRMMCRSMEEYKKRNDPQPKIVTAHQKALEKWRGEKGADSYCDGRVE